MSEILIDNLTGKTSAGDITVTSEGGAATMQLQQGLAKCWVNFNGTGTIATRDSLSLSSLSDLGTGVYQLNISNTFNNANYSNVGSLGNAGRINPNDVLFIHPDHQNTTDSRVFNCLGTGAAADRVIVTCQITGDLA